MIGYTITDWQRLYENSETRKLKSLKWVALPNKHDGLGFRLMTREKDAAKLFAAWVMIVQIASRAELKEERGTLIRGGRAMTPDDLEAMTGFESAIFARALSFFSSRRVNWITAIPCEESPGEPGEFPGESGEFPGEPGESPGVPGSFPVEGKGREGKGIEGKEENSRIASDVARIWESYPDKTGKPKSVEYLTADLRAGHKAEDIIAGVERYKASVKAKRENGFPELKWKNGSSFFHQREWQSEHTIEPDYEPEPPRFNDKGERIF